LDSAAKPPKTEWSESSFAYNEKEEGERVRERARGRRRNDQSRRSRTGSSSLFHASCKQERNKLQKAVPRAGMV